MGTVVVKVRRVLASCARRRRPAAARSIASASASTQEQLAMEMPAAYAHSMGSRRASKVSTVRCSTT